MREIDAFTVIADSFDDLVLAVGTGNTYNHVYLGQNITLQRGVTIDPAKTSLIIDGTYEDITCTLTDTNSTAFDQAFGIRATSSIDLTVQNIIINGGNYYGVPYIAESTLLRDTSGVVITYRNVRYTGPQITYHLNGLTRYFDCDITIEQTGVAPAQEVGEVNRVEFGGVTTIYHTSVGDDPAVFWFRGDEATMSLTVLEGARLTVNSVNSYFMYNMLPVFLTPYPVRYVIEPGGSFDLTARLGLSFSANNQISSLLVDEGASFRYVQTATLSTSDSLYLNGALTVNRGASVYMQANTAGARPLLNLRANQARLLLTYPKSFVLYNSAGPALAVTAGAAAAFDLTTRQINYWNPATALENGAGSLTDRPLHKWAKADWSNFHLWGSATSAATTVTGSDATEEELGTAFNLFQLTTARVLSAGDLTITANTILDSGSPISGRTEPGAVIRVAYEIDGTAHTFDDAAGADGTFSISTADEEPPNVPVDTVVSLWSNTPFLIVMITATSITAGDLILERVPMRIRFNTPTFTADSETFFQRSFPSYDEPVVVFDTRAESTQWELLVSITGDLETTDGYTLPDALVFRAEGQALVTLGGEPTVVYTGGPSTSAEERTTILWQPEEGILLLADRPIRLRKQYLTGLIWALRTPEEP